MKLAHSRLKSEVFPAVVGERGVTQDIPLGQLTVDESYQLKLNTSKVRQYAKNWDWNAYTNISVNRRPDGSYYVYDGKHRTQAALLRGDIETLPCRVVEMENAPEEARAFVNINVNRRTVTPYEKLNAALVAGDPGALFVKACLDAQGIRISANGVWPGATNAIKAFMNESTKLTDKSMRDIQDAIKICSIWRDQEKGFSGRVVEGVFAMLKRVADRKFLMDRAEDQLGRYDIAEIYGRAQSIALATTSHFGKVFPQELIERFNKGLRKKKLA